MGDDEKDIIGAGRDTSSDEIDKPGLITPKEKEIITSPDGNEFHKSIYDEDSKAPLGVVKRDPEPDEVEDILDFVGTETGLMYGVLDYDVLSKFAPPGIEWEWEDYQLRHLDCTSNYIANKARQVGMSASFAAKAFARGILTTNQNYTAIFTSYKKEEAVNKVKYVKQFLSALPLQFQKKIVRDPQQLIEWENADGTKCKIISHAQRPIRGAHGDIFLDELAFYQFADLIYESALYATEMMGGTIDITSTPFGKFGKFYEIVANADEFPGYYRDWIYWWDCKRYLKHSSDEYLAYASTKAFQHFKKEPEAVEERVHEFGNAKLKRLFSNSATVESFRQEVEGFFVDEQASFISQSLILKCMFPTSLSAIDDYDPHESDFDIPIDEALADKTWPIVDKYERVNFKTYDTIEELYSAVARGEVSDNLVGGADIGTTQHHTEFVIMEELQLPDGKTLQVERFNLSRSKWKLPDQKAYFNSVLSDGFLRKLRMDCTGIGKHMGQELSSVWDESTFEALHMGGSSQKQEREMVNLRSRMEEWGLAMAYDKQKIHDLHSIKRVITQNKNVSYRATERKRHHADYAWAVAFASLAGTAFGEEPVDLSFKDLDGMKVSMKESMGDDSSFVDDFNRDHVNNSGGEVDFGDSLNLGFDEDYAIKKLSPGKFNNKWNE
jgi:phage FluMu gp28-like protein